MLYHRPTLTTPLLTGSDDVNVTEIVPPVTMLGETPPIQSDDGLATSQIVSVSGGGVAGGASLLPASSVAIV